MSSRQVNPDPRDGPKPTFPEQEQAPTGSQAKMDPQPDYGLTSYKGCDKLKDHIAVVTGGDSGIGRAVAVAFAREGADVVVGYFEHREDAEVTKQAVEAAGRQCLLFGGDLGEDAECRRLIDETVAKFGRIDVLVNNAAYQGKTVESPAELDRARVEHTFRVNVLSMFSTVRYALPHMKPGSAIINTGSIQAYQPSASILDYATTKGAIVAFTKGLAPDLIEKGIRANCVAPGPVWTPLVVASFPAEKNAKFGETNPYGRPAQPVELAGAYVFLASQDSKFVTGEVLAVTGGKITA